MENAIMDINMAACDSERKPLPTAANSEPSRPASTVESGSRENFEMKKIFSLNYSKTKRLEAIGWNSGYPVFEYIYERKIIIFY